MRLPRERQFDPAAPPWLHCISRCVRRAYLCGEGFEHRKGWLERRLALLSQCFAVQIGAYAIMSNHIHVVLRPRPQEVASWSAERVARAWLMQRENVDLNTVGLAGAASVAQRVALLVEDRVFIARWRERFGSVSHFMKALKEPFSRMANREDDCSGTFWEGRFRSIPLLNTPAIIACMAYVDLNPIRAQLAEMPEESAFTSVKNRIELRTQETTQAAQQRVNHWLTPVEEMTSSQAGDPGLSLEQYLTLVDQSGRYMRSADKRGVIPSDLAAILQRLAQQAQPNQRENYARTWLETIRTPHGMGGSALGSLSQLAEEAKRRGLQWVQTRCRLFARRQTTP